jgi:hypothetical protein
MAFFMLVVAVWAVAAHAGMNNGLVAYYPFDGDCADLSGNGHHGLPHGGVLFEAGFRGSCASFDGVDDYVELPRMVEEDFSVVFRVQTTAIAPPGTEWWQGLGMVDAEVCGLPPGGDWGIALLDYDGPGGGQVCFNSGPSGSVSTTDINDGSWYAVIATKTADTGAASIWINGVEEGFSPTGWIGPLTGPDWIGVGNNACDVSFNRLWFPGLIDDLRFYDRVLSPFEIGALSADYVFFDDFESGDVSEWSSVVP